MGISKLAKLELDNILTKEVLEKSYNEFGSLKAVLEYGGNGVVSKITNYLYRDSTICLQRKFDIAILSKTLMCPNRHFASV